MAKSSRKQQLPEVDHLDVDGRPTSPAAAHFPAHRRVFIQAILYRIIAFSNRLDDHWVGDFIGLVCLVLTGILGVIIAGVFQ